MPSDFITYSTEEESQVTSKLTERDLPTFLRQLTNHAAKWRVIGIHLGFLPGELANIEARPNLSQGAPVSWFAAMLEDWLQWAPGDSRGSTSFATLVDLKIALSEAGLGASAHDLKLQSIGVQMPLDESSKMSSGTCKCCYSRLSSTINFNLSFSDVHAVSSFPAREHEATGIHKSLLKAPRLNELMLGDSHDGSHASEEVLESSKLRESLLECSDDQQLYYTGDPTCTPLSTKPTPHEKKANQCLLQ